MRTSICLSTRNQANVLSQVLASIRQQDVPFEYEVIVADDGSTDVTKSVCAFYGAKHIYLENNHYRNPATARNAAYRAATGDIVINQSGDVLHKSNCIQQLTEGLKDGELLFATVYNVDTGGTLNSFPVYSGKARPCNFFFLGALWRRDLYKVGGNDERFQEPCFDDDYLAFCLTKGLGLVPRYEDDIIGHHLSHGHPDGAFNNIEVSRKLYLDNCAAGRYGNEPWEYK